MRRCFAVTLVMLAACTHTHGGVVAPEAVHADIVALLAHGAAAWNRGDLDGFMSDYAEDATYVTKTAVVHGRAEIRARYHDAYFAPGAHRDSLHFEDLELDVVGPGVVNAIAYYVLTRGDSTTARGPTSLIIKKVGGRWLIVHDHSS